MLDIKFAIAALFDEKTDGEFAYFIAELQNREPPSYSITELEDMGFGHGKS